MEALLPYLIPLIAAVLAGLFYKFFKINLDKDKLARLLSFLAELIFSVEDKYRGISGAERKEKVVEITEKALDEGEKGLLTKVYGSVKEAVQVAFRIAQPVIEMRKIIKKIK